MQVISTEISGCFAIEHKQVDDPRGGFSKPYQSSAFKAAGFDVDFVEDFYSLSHRNVLRGMHFQKPPFDHAKLVYCITGSAMDVVVDLRLTSPTFGHHIVFELAANDPICLYICSGLAHGFLALEDDTIISYKTSSEHSPSHDTGIHWDSLDIKWPVSNPVVSDRDAAFLSFQDFATPFIK